MEGVLIEWWIIVRSGTEAEYKTNWAVFAKKYQRNYLKVVQYIAKEWLLLYKKKIVKIWANNHLHFNNQATGRAEVIHVVIKQYIQFSRKYLKEVIEDYSRMIEY